MKEIWTSVTGREDLELQKQKKRILLKEWMKVIGGSI